MKIWGLLLILAGATVALVALLVMPSTLSAEEMMTLPYSGSIVGSGRFTETYNLPRAQLREMVFHGGGLLFLSGVILFVGGALDERLQRRTRSDATGIALEFANAETAEESRFAEPTPIQPMDPDEAARNKKIALGLVAAAVLILTAFFLVSLSKANNSTSPDAMDAYNAAENASRAADNAMNAALNAADNAARAAGG